MALLTLCLIVLASGLAASRKFEKDIIANYIERNYGSRSVIPTLNSSGPLNVTLRLLIAQLVDFDEPEQKLTIHAWQKMSWRDELLVWNPDDYGGQNVIHVFPSDIWMPRLVILENVNFDFSNAKEIEIIITADGSAVWYAPVMLKTSCKVHVKNFPFDIQQCSVTFMAWTYDMSDINLRFFEDEDSKQMIYNPNGVWDVENVNVSRVEVKYKCCEYPYPQIVYTLSLRRASRVYILSILVPLILLKMLTLAVFWMPAESGEKISLGMTNLLAFVLFQQLISANMPPVGNETAILTIYIFCMVVQSCASVCVSVYVLRLYHTPPSKPIRPCVIRLLTHLGQQKECITWQVVSRVFDKAMFVLFLLVSILMVVISLFALSGQEW
ncbi:neuronal acetylcholine receptor subunit alpha-10-like [Acanthaster planci]|uniref:Neuronal acetylcholine receptor subunit alpha-10-like n=1 Tax=Acanthaster planci TaxID=133434 RepID=A0A8B7XQY5_ACAPL|nr:neuronal acetylcholine receptor subunit alpha-10-like [Acanthaster planci]XP_022083252.1 neuronal acetylcholine receptor subunit alpha-10-like [Acanthaster planci]XP_022083253.1 neuronal acetylcholine receptor subunit alpha-10-like [Acanthaster planci]XP_022083254.1 neuronal acetylcholine receptor subunit alpha-10-like [Acanthaster planci]